MRPFAGAVRDDKVVEGPSRGRAVRPATIAPTIEHGRNRGTPDQDPVDKTFCVRDTRVGRPHHCHAYKEGCLMSTTAETGEVTGTKDKDYNLIWYTEKCWITRCG